MHSAFLRSGSSSQWLSRTEDVTAHLLYAATEIGEAELDGSGGTIRCTFNMPMNTTSVVSMRMVDDDSSRPKAGQVVRVRYSRGNSSYGFLTRISSVANNEQVLLEAPVAIERNERRIVARHQFAQGGGGFRFCPVMGDGRRWSLALSDMSAAGLGFVFDPARMALDEGDSLRGSVQIPGAHAVPVVLEVRNIRDSSTVPGHKIAGCRFARIELSERRRLQRALVSSARPH